ncbi:MAG: ABC-F family ATP-binding cassette domain-containing protein [Candidatus Krumholzibacteria bacterium]|nr:ABC-F family ATP-binding cassette domain-containing protein [Candidatus Krumholzibacteria bacterium]
MIIVDNISKGFGAQELFAGTGFRLNAGERVGLIGRNGHGKTTLLRMIIGEERPDSGSIVIPRGYSIGYVDQEPRFGEDTVLSEGCRGLPPAERDHRWKVEKVLAGLGFTAGQMQSHPSLLSSGFQARLNLGKVLVQGADLLLLDEPNNYLDITSIRWLERFLRGWKGEFILITHDRGFMDGVVTHVVGIHRRTFRKIRGDTGKYYSQIAMDEEVYEKTRLNDERKRRQTEEFINRFRAKARLAGLVQSRVKALEKQQRLEKLEQEKDLDFSFRSRPFNGKPVMHARGISFAWERSAPLFADLSFTVGPSDRICVIGPNGKGKTTLLKVLAGQLAPGEGDVAVNATAEVSYYGQSAVEDLSPERTVVEEIASAAPSMDQQQARNIAGTMMFEGDDALKKIRVLSGGEKSRVMLGKVIATPVNLLLLDEPTNHLDLESCDALLEAIADFDGAVVMVTHNEMLIHGLADRLIVFQGGGARLYEGSYRDFLETRGWEEERESAEVPADEEATGRRQDRRAAKRMRAGIVNERSRTLAPLKKRIDELERSIVGYEKELEKLHEEIEAASRQGDGARIAEASRGVGPCEQSIAQCFEKLEAAHDEYERLNREFEERLDAVDRER